MFFNALARSARLFCCARLIISLVIMGFGFSEYKTSSNCLLNFVPLIKERKLFWFNNTRIHLDEVKELGNFLELETLLLDGKADAEKRFASFAINKFGYGGHPIANKEQLPHFATDYLKDCLNIAIHSLFIKDEGKIIGKKLLSKLTA